MNEMLRIAPQKMPAQAVPEDRADKESLLGPYALEYHTCFFRRGSRPGGTPKIDDMAHGLQDAAAGPLDAWRSRKAGGPGARHGPRQRAGGRAGSGKYDATRVAPSAAASLSGGAMGDAYSDSGVVAAVAGSVCEGSGERQPANMGVIRARARIGIMRMGVNPMLTWSGTRTPGNGDPTGSGNNLVHPGPHRGVP